MENIADPLSTILGSDYVLTSFGNILNPHSLIRFIHRSRLT